MCIYIYIEREREEQKGRERYRERERKRNRSKKQRMRIRQKSILEPMSFNSSSGRKTATPFALSSSCLQKPTMKSTFLKLFVCALRGVSTCPNIGRMRPARHSDIRFNKCEFRRVFFVLPYAPFEAYARTILRSTEFALATINS